MKLNMRLIQVAATVVIAGLINACSESVAKDPYTVVTLREATRGHVVSKDFKYRFVNPQVVALHQNLGLIREGNILEFVAARSLADKLEGYETDQLELNVVKKYSPFVHFRVDKVVASGDTIDFPPVGAIAYPQIRTPEEYSTDTYEAQDIDAIPYNNTGVLNRLKDKKMKISGRITLEEEEGQKYFVLNGKNAKLRIGQAGNGTELIMKVLAEGNYLFEGGVTFTAVEDYAPRMKTHVAGTVNVQFVNYGNKIITG